MRYCVWWYLLWKQAVHSCIVAQSWSKAVHPSQAPVAFPHNGSTPDSEHLIPAYLFSCQRLWLILSIQLTGVRRLETESNFILNVAFG